MIDREQKLERALLVMLLDSRHRAWMNTHDPQAVKQAIDALGDIPELAKVTEFDPRPMDEAQLVHITLHEYVNKHPGLGLQRVAALLVEDHPTLVQQYVNFALAIVRVVAGRPLGDPRDDQAKVAAMKMRAAVGPLTWLPVI